MQLNAPPCPRELPPIGDDNDEVELSNTVDNLFANDEQPPEENTNRDDNDDDDDGGYASSDPVR